MKEAIAAADELGYPVVVKGQILHGGRGKAGLIKRTSESVIEALALTQPSIEIPKDIEALIVSGFKDKFFHSFQPEIEARLSSIHETLWNTSESIFRIVKLCVEGPVNSGEGEELNHIISTLHPLARTCRT